MTSSELGFGSRRLQSLLYSVGGRRAIASKQQMVKKLEQWLK
ncbi:hypothetical protein [Nostoc sp.]